MDLINTNINRDVQEECANRLYRVYTHTAAMRMMENSECLRFTVILDIIGLSENHQTGFHTNAYKFLN